MIELEEREPTGASIKVIGIGGGGGNAINTMIESDLTGVEFIAANTDIQSLKMSKANSRLQIGHELTKGLGAGANPEVGRQAAIDDRSKISDMIAGADMVFITAGMGGGTGTGAAPVVAQIAKDIGALVIGIVTRPFLFEGKKRRRIADEGILTLKDSVDSLITIPNQKLLNFATPTTSLLDTFKKADEVLLQAVRGISDLINEMGIINLDFADVKTIMANRGLALMGTGNASGEKRALEAATNAISSPLLEEISIQGATGVIINITGPSDLSLLEINEAATFIQEEADPEAEIIFGASIDPNFKDNVRVTIIATGFGSREEQRADTAIPVHRFFPQTLNLNDIAENDASEIPPESLKTPSYEEDSGRAIDNALEEEISNILSPNGKGDIKKELAWTAENGKEDHQDLIKQLGLNLSENDLDYPTFLRKE